MYRDAQGALYVHDESTASLAEEKKPSAWPWVVAGAAIVAGAALWMSQSPTRRENPVDPAIDPLLLEAANPDTPWKRLYEIARHRDREVKQALLQNPNLCPIDDKGNVNTGLLLDLAFKFPDEVAESPAFILHAFYGDPTPMLRVIERIVYKTKSPERVRSMLSLFGSLLEDIRWNASRNEVTPPDILRELAEEFPRAVVFNPNAPPEVLRELAAKWPGAVAGNPKAPPEVLRELAKKYPEEVARNPNTFPEVLRELMNYHLQSVRDGAKKNLSRRGLL